MTDHDHTARHRAQPPAGAPSARPAHPGYPPAPPREWPPLSAPARSSAQPTPAPPPPHATATAAPPAHADAARPAAAQDEPASVAGPVPQRIWRESREGLVSVSVWTERVPGRGEDAEPFVAHHLESRQGLLAVFDGSGGAGAAPVWQAPDGTHHTSAWVGARVARLATDCWFREVATGREEAGPESLREYLRYFLSAAPQRRSKIGGTMRRQLPTTLAAVHYRAVGSPVEPELELQPLWAGDSRAYVLHPDTGLRVLTRDHTRESDALELLRTDPPMTNLVCADREFEIDSQRLTYRLPCVLVAATDGFFGYVHTPADFESLLLRTLHQAGHIDEWADQIRREVQGYTADDASIAVLALGYRRFEDLRGAFAARLRDVTDRYVRTRPRGLDHLAATAADAPAVPEDPAELPNRVRAWQDETWHTYRAGYETHLPPAPEEHV